MQQPRLLGLMSTIQLGFRIGWQREFQQNVNHLANLQKYNSTTGVELTPRAITGFIEDLNITSTQMPSEMVQLSTHAETVTTTVASSLQTSNGM